MIDEKIFETAKEENSLQTVKEVWISASGAVVDGSLVSQSDITGLYREFAGDYPKFFKMDMLCRLGFVAAELALRDIPADEKENGAVILFNRNGSLITDRNYEDTVRDAENYFPSPALFVYTLANIVTGEIAIRHKIYGETSFYIMETPDWEEIEAIVKEAFENSDAKFILAGWVDYNDEKNYLAHFKVYKRY